MTLSEHVKSLRKQENLTQQELADRAGVGIHFVRDLEQGKKTVIGKQKCNDFGKMICSKIGNNGTMFSATRVQYYWQQSCSTSKGSIFLIDSSFFK